MTFINRFPNQISISLQQLPGVHIIEMGELITFTRVLARQEHMQGTAIVGRSSVQPQVAKEQLSGLKRRNLKLQKKRNLMFQMPGFPYGKRL